MQNARHCAMMSMQALNGGVIDNVDAAFRAVNRLNKLIQIWPSAPSDLHRLRDTTGKLHNLLNGYLRVQSDEGSIAGVDDDIRKLLDHDIAYTKRVLKRVEEFLDALDASNVTLERARFAAFVKTAWSAQIDTIANLQADIDNCCHQALLRLTTLTV